jgi:hypothetical protein
MAYTGIIVTEAQIALMAGENVDATGDTEANHNDLAAQAEAYLCNLVKYDIVTNWGFLNTIYQQMFSEWAARYAGMTLILYNMAGYTSRVEAEDMINIHVFRMNEIRKLLEDPSVQDFMGVSS